MGNPIADPKLKLKFFSTLGEKYRIYVYPGFDEVMITGSVTMAIATNHSHRVLTNEGKAYFVPDKFLYMMWEVEDGNDIPYFRF